MARRTAEDSPISLPAKAMPLGGADGTGEIRRAAGLVPGLDPEARSEAVAAVYPRRILAGLCERASSRPEFVARIGGVVRRASVAAIDLDDIGEAPVPSTQSACLQWASFGAGTSPCVSKGPAALAGSGITKTPNAAVDVVSAEILNPTWFRTCSAVRIALPVPRRRR